MQTLLNLLAGVSLLVWGTHIVRTGILRMDDVVDQLYTAVKLYLTQIPREALEQREGRRWADIVSFAINMSAPRSSTSPARTRSCR